jgi:beta-lactamase class D
MRLVSELVVTVFVLAAGVAASQVTHAARVECFILAQPGARPYVSDAAECGHATSPASTFKIPHALIALDTAVVRADDVVRWDGGDVAHESWRQDHTLATAIQWSVVPYFQRTARLIGRERMRRGLAMLHYADDSFERDVDAFWLDGDLVVSPQEQFAFLGRLARGTLPLSRAHMATVLNAMRMPRNEVLMAGGAHPFALAWPDGTIVRAKTGNTTVAGERVSWLVGALELDGRQHVFVARVRSSGTLPSSAGADLALRELNARRVSGP